MDTRLLVALAAAFGLGAAVILAGSFHPAGRARARELWTLYLYEILVVALVVVPALAGGAIFLAALLALLWRGQYELAKLFGLRPFDAAGVAAMLLGAPMLAFGAFGRIDLVCYAAVAAAAALALYAAFRAVPRRRLAVALASLVYPGLLLALLGALRATPDGAGWVILVYFAAELQDAFALLFGKLLGRHRVLPRLSPGKTWEGLAFGLAFGGVGGVLLARLLLHLPYTAAILPVALMLVGGLAGDVLASAIKRARGEKDFAALVPALGGALDIYDALLVAAPLVLAYRLAG
jgi:phosphatidate cytidylyltransferase